jgi:hypothetical protein
LEGIVIHHAFLFDLLGDAFEPFSLGLGPEEALGGNHPGHGGIDVLPKGDERGAQCLGPDVTHEAGWAVQLFRLAPGFADVGSAFDSALNSNCGLDDSHPLAPCNWSHPQNLLISSFSVEPKR